ncbi:hypothetical protein BGX21_003153 [Mortierella sp. AD011]|nr:hypothetical protein BGX20_003805 [Mortierella sp. AD010]KAF9377615.1 hypothetical protein BGX21_003153 [Mortierella sp. AD011]
MARNIIKLYEEYEEDSDLECNSISISIGSSTNSSISYSPRALRSATTKKPSSKAKRVSRARYTTSDASLESEFFNILVLGERQSGKSTLIEAIKNYPNQDVLDHGIPTYTPTTAVTSTCITTTLPRFSIFENANARDDTSRTKQLNNNDVRQYLSIVREEYEQQKSRLHLQKDPQTPNPYKFKFRLIDTPGLDFVKDGSKKILKGEGSGAFVSKTLPAIVEQLGPTCAVHLVLLIVQDPDNYDNSDAVNFYRDMLPAFDFITVVAHGETKGDRATPVSKAQPQHKSSFGDSYADQIHFIIGDMFIRDDPIRDYLTRNDIRRILELALLNEPVFMQLKKPSFIKDLDNFLEDRYFELLKTIHNAVATAKESSPFHTILQLTKVQCDEYTRMEATLLSSPLKLVFSRRFENTWDVSSTDNPIEVEMESTEGEITHVDILQHNIKIVKQDGGVGAQRLKIAFRWTSAFYGVFDIRIYVNTIATSRDSNDIQKNIADAIQNATSDPESPPNQHKLIMELLQKYRQFHLMRHLASIPIVYPETIRILSICDIDQVTPIDLFQCVEDLEKVYLGAVDAYTPKPTFPDKTFTNVIVDGGSYREAVFPTINRFQRHLLDRRAMAPWSKNEQNPILFDASLIRPRPLAPIMHTTAFSRSGLKNIWQYAKGGNLTFVKYHLQMDPSLINTPWKFDGRSVLISACGSSRPFELVEFLVQQGAQVNIMDSFLKRTALHTLCEEGGITVDDREGSTIAIPQADPDAAEQGVLATMRFLLDNGATVNAKNCWKETPLMRLLSGRDCPLMVQELYSRGADSRLKSSKNAYPHGTALCYAAYFGRVKSLKWMIENDLLLSDEANIKDALRWANAISAKRGKEHKVETIRLLESWLGDSGATKRKALAKEISTQSEEDWWRRMSGIVEDVQNKMESNPSSAISTGNSKIPPSMLERWKEVQSLSESLSRNSGKPPGPNSWMKWFTG